MYVASVIRLGLAFRFLTLSHVCVILTDGERAKETSRVCDTELDARSLRYGSHFAYDGKSCLSVIQINK